MREHRKAFEKFRKNLSEELGGSLERLVLFGSVARGEHTQESDVDVLVVLDDRSLKEQVFEISYDVMLEDDVYISPKVLDNDQFESLKDSSFGKSIQEEMEAYA
jgi:predicted nucleotidyltransferase